MSAPEDAPVGGANNPGHERAAAVELQSAALLPGTTANEIAWLLWGLALLSAMAGLLSRAVEPALPGVWMGIDHFITAVKLGGALSSQLFAVVGSVAVFMLTFLTVRATHLPSYVRAYSVGSSALVVLAVVVAALSRKLPEGAALVLSGTAAIWAVMSARLALRFSNLRAAALVMGMIAIGGVMRIGSIILADVTAATGSDLAEVGARIAATIAQLTEAVAVATVAVWLVLRTPAERSRGKHPRWISLAVSILGASGLLVVAELGRAADVSGGHVFMARALTELLRQPEPYLPWLVRGFIELWGWWLVAVTLVVAPRTRLMSAVVALSLVARTSLEVPLCAMALSTAALALAQHPGPVIPKPHP
jgi:hypothetical protein